LYADFEDELWISFASFGANPCSLASLFPVFFGPQKLSDFFSSEKSGATSEDCGEKSLISALVGCSL
jgi:hypothetical protein